MINQFFVPKLIEKAGSLDSQWFQQDSATPHTARETIALLETVFEDRLVSRNPRWPPRSPDLTVPDFFLWGMLKGKVYETNPRTISELEERIRVILATVDLAMLNRVFQSFENRVKECIENKGGHIE
jgi:hypothetical protein